MNSLLATLPSLFGLALAVLAVACQSPEPPEAGGAKGEIQIDPQGRWIEFDAVVYPESYDLSNGIHGHHLIVWRGGKAARKALFRAEVSDRDISPALRRIGARSGDNLSRETWSERNDSEAEAPRWHTEGTTLTLSVTWEGAPGWLGLMDILEVDGGAEPVIRFGGHDDLIDIYESGCITCLYSCPGGRTSNASATIREQALGTIRFASRGEVLPSEGKIVKIRMSIPDELRPANGGNG